MRTLALAPLLLLLSPVPAPCQMTGDAVRQSLLRIVVESQNTGTPAVFRTRILPGESFVTVRPRARFAELASSERPTLVVEGTSTPMSMPIDSDDVFTWELSTEASGPGLRVRLDAGGEDRGVHVQGRDLVVRRTRRGGPIEIVAVVRP